MTLKEILNKNNNSILFKLRPELIEDFRDLPEFTNSRLDVYNNIICDENDLKIVILKDDTIFVGNAYLHSIMCFFPTHPTTFISVCGVFDAYTNLENIKI